MDLQEEIAKRIQNLRAKNKYSQKFVAGKLKITQAAYSLIEASKNRISTEHILVLSDLYGVPTDYILKGQKNFHSASYERGFMSRNSIKAHAGFIKNNTEDLVEDEYEYYRIPGYDTDSKLKLFEVEGSSMVPSMFPKDIVVCQEVDLKKVRLNDPVVVVTEDAVLAKRILKIKGNENITFKNDNPADTETLTLPMKEIKDIYIVRGKITNTLVPFHQMVSKGKISEINESLEFLKKEIYEINRKIDLDLNSH